MIGQKIIGNWGAMFPYSYGTVVSYDEKTLEFVVAWDETDQDCAPVKGFYKVGDLMFGKPGKIGIYFAEDC